MAVVVYPHIRTNGPTDQAGFNEVFEATENEKGNASC